MSKNSWETPNDRTCCFCGKMWQYAHQARYCETLRIPAVPPMKPGCRFRLTETAFTERFPKVKPEDNVFTIAGPLVNAAKIGGERSPEATGRTMDCQIVYVSDGALGCHVNKIRVRWLGEEGNRTASRFAYVFESEITDISAS